MQYQPISPPAAGLTEFSRYTYEELQRIAASLDLAGSDPAFGGLRITSTNTNSVGTTPVKIGSGTNWDATMPASGFKGTTPLVGGGIVLAARAVYHVNVCLTVKIAASMAYRAEIYIATFASGVATLVDTSNTNVAVQLALSGFVVPIAEDITIDLRVNAGSAAQQFDITRADFVVTKVDDV